MGENREAEEAFRSCAIIFTAILTEDGEYSQFDLLPAGNGPYLSGENEEKR